MATLAEIMQDEEFCARVRAELLPTIWNCTVPLFVEQGDAIRQSGTSTLLRIADRLFLVTAAHVLLDAKKASVTLRARSHELRATLMPLIGRFIHLRSDSENVFDSAVMELNAETAVALSGYQPVSLSDIDRQQQATDDLYIVAGFPCELAREGTKDGSPVKLTRFFGFTYPYRGSTSRLTNYDPRHHVLLDARREYAATIVGDGSPPGSFKGLSGCSLWKVNATIVDRGKWKPSHAKIIAVQTSEYTDPGVLKGTKWSNLVRAIHEDCPELRPSLGLEFP